jgi:hypothetical protein
MTTPHEVTDLEMMQTPAWWPLGFRLPLKKVVDGQLRYGFLVDYHADEFWWFDGKTIYDDVSTADITGTLRRGELQRLIDEGWMVD